MPIHHTMQACVDKFNDQTVEIIKRMQGASDLPQIAAVLGDEVDPVAGLSYSGYFAMIEALRAALPLIDGADEESIRVRALIVRALGDAGEVA